MKKRNIINIDNLNFEPFDNYGISIEGMSWHKISYDKKKGVIKWELIKTSRKTNSFKIISKNKVEFDNGNRRSLLYRQKNK